MAAESVASLSSFQSGLEWKPQLQAQKSDEGLVNMSTGELAAKHFRLSRHSACEEERKTWTSVHYGCHSPITTLA